VKSPIRVAASGCCDTSSRSRVGFSSTRKKRQDVLTCRRFEKAQPAPLLETGIVRLVQLDLQRNADYVPERNSTRHLAQGRAGLVQLQDLFD